MNSDILVGISTYNDYKYTELLLQSIRWYTYQDDNKFEIVVCDDGTRSKAAGIPGIRDEAEETYSRLKDACNKFGATLIEHETNMGIPATWNHLANALGANSKYIVILNNDLIVPPNWLKVAIYFLEANYDNPHVGSCFWNPVNRVPYDAMRAMLPMLGHTLFTTQDQVRGYDLGHSMLNIDVGSERLFAVPHMNTRVGDGHGLGRVMCPCGCCFAMTRKVWEQCGPFREDLVSFHEESVKRDRYLVYKQGDNICVDTVEDIFTKYASTMVTRDGRDYVFPTDMQALSAEAKTDAETVSDFFLTKKEKDGRTAQHRLCARKKMENKDLHVNSGIWDTVEYIVRHSTTKRLLDSRNKFGATCTTPDHSLIVWDGDTSGLSEAKPEKLNGASLERVDVFPDVTGIDTVDLLQWATKSKLDGADRVAHDDEYMWFDTKAYTPTRIYRFVKVGTPEMDALCSIIGAFVSEGCIGHGEWQYQATVCCSNDIEAIRYVQRCMELVIPVSSHISVSRKEQYADVYSCVVGERIASLVLDGMCSHKSESVRLPNFVFRLPEEHQRQVWKELLRGDGFQPKKLGYYYRSEDALNKYFVYTTKSRGLIADLSVLLSMFGEKFTIGKRTHSNGSVSYWIRNAIKFYGPRGCETIVEEDEPEGEKYVYDLGTKNTHMFVDGEGLVLLHNSLFGTKCAEAGRASFGFSYPRPYHTHGYTFSVNAELRAGERMRQSRKMYREIMGVPDNVPDDKYFEWVHNKLMTQIPPTRLKYLVPNYSKDPVERKLPGGEVMLTPYLDETEGEF